MFWFHPLVHWYRRALRNLHEYLADAEASRRINLQQYGLLLIRQSQPGMPVALVHHFFQSPLKQRFIMLTQKASAPSRTLKYGLLLPLTLVFVLLFRQVPVIAQNVDPHLQRMQLLEKNNWVEIDTIITFDPNSYKETMVVKRSDLGPFKEPGTGRQVYQLCEEMPKWIPGIQKGKPVDCEMILPIKYKLD